MQQWIRQWNKINIKHNLKWLYREISTYPSRQKVYRYIFFYSTVSLLEKSLIVEIMQWPSESKLLTEAEEEQRSESSHLGLDVPLKLKNMECVPPSCFGPSWAKPGIHAKLSVIIFLDLHLRRCDKTRQTYEEASWQRCYCKYFYSSMEELTWLQCRV